MFTLVKYEIQIFSEKIICVISNPTLIRSPTSFSLFGTVLPFANFLFIRNIGSLQKDEDAVMLSLIPLKCFNNYTRKQNCNTHQSQSSWSRRYPGNLQDFFRPYRTLRFVYFPLDHLFWNL